MRQVLTITLILVTVGIITIYSASAIFADDRFGDQYYFFKRQLLWASIGMLGLAVASLLPLELLRKLSKAIIVLAVALLVAVVT